MKTFSVKEKKKKKKKKAKRTAPPPMEGPLGNKYLTPNFLT